MGYTPAGMLLLIGFSVVATYDRFMMEAEDFFLLKELEAINPCHCRDRPISVSVAVNAVRI